MLMKSFLACRRLPARYLCRGRCQRADRRTEGETATPSADVTLIGCRYRGGEGQGLQGRAFVAHLVRLHERGDGRRQG